MGLEFVVERRFRAISYARTHALVHDMLFYVLVCWSTMRQSMTVFRYEPDGMFSVS